MEAGSFSEASITFHQSTRRRVPEQSILQPVILIYVDMRAKVWVMHKISSFVCDMPLWSLFLLTYGERQASLCFLSVPAADSLRRPRLRRSWRNGRGVTGERDSFWDGFLESFTPRTVLAVYIFWVIGVFVWLYYLKTCIFLTTSFEVFVPL
jgi:hypothetical protein